MALLRRGETAMNCVVMHVGEVAFWNNVGEATSVRESVCGTMVGAHVAVHAGFSRG